MIKCSDISVFCKWHPQPQSFLPLHHLMSSVKDLWSLTEATFTHDMQTIWDQQLFNTHTLALLVEIFR